MQLSLFRLTMIVPLLVSVIPTEINQERSSNSKKDQTAIKAFEENESGLSNEIKLSSNRNQKPFVNFERSKRNVIYSHDQNSKIRRGRMNSMISGPHLPDSNGLARKLAKEALKSPKMQETMKKLTKISKSPKNHYEAIKGPAVVAKSTTGKKKIRKPTKHKGRKKKKHKRRHRRFRSQHSHWPKRGSSKDTSNIGRNVNMKMKKQIGDRSTTTINYDRYATIKDKLRNVTLTPISRDNIQIVTSNNEDYIDFSTILTTQTSLFTRKFESVHESESMIERLMKTTTRDPRKKSTGDQGAEYSEYYNDNDDDEILEDIAANKIQMKLAEPENFNDRFTRQTIDNSSLYANPSFAGYVVPFSSNNHKYDKDFIYDDRSMRMNKDVQNYPSFVSSVDVSNQNSRFLTGDDNSGNYPPNYAMARKYERLNQPDFLNTETIPLIRDQFNEVTISDVERNDKHDYTNRYMKGGINDVKSFEVSQPFALNPNENVDTRMDRKDFSHGNEEYGEIQRNSNFDNIMSPEKYENYNRYGGSKEGINFEFNQMHNPDFHHNIQPKIEKIDENFQQPLVQSAVPNNEQFLPEIDNKQRIQNGKQSLTSFSHINDKMYDPTNEYPTMNLQNAMEQPLGKILKTLGINVQADSNTNQLQDGSNEAWYRKDNENNLRLPDLQTAKHIDESLQNDAIKHAENLNTGEEHLKTLEIRPRTETRKEDSSQLMEENRSENVEATNISITVNETKEIANEILGRIMDELEELKTNHKKNNKREGLPCRLSGSWLTTRAGMKLNMKVVNRSIIVHLKELIPPLPYEVLFNASWNVTGHAPFRRGAPFSLIATNNHTKSMAVFIGACKVCQGVDTIAGVWSIARQPKDCRDFQIATSVVNDIFRKTKLSTMKEDEPFVSQDSTKNNTYSLAMDNDKREKNETR